MTVEHRFGPHTVRVEEHIIVIKFVGGATLEDFQRQMEVIEQVGERLTRMIVLVDLSEAELSDPRARKYAAEKGGQLIPQALICYGASLFIRTAAMLVISATRMVGKKIPNAIFVKTEAEARALAATYLK